LAEIWNAGALWVSGASSGIEAENDWRPQVAVHAALIATFSSFV